jgi:glutathione S-transferase
MIKIYHTPGARSVRVLWLMEELGEAYEVERVSFPPSAEFRARNPQGTLPFIEDDGIAMAESIAILQYITGRRIPNSYALTIGPKPDPAAYAAHLQFLHAGEASLTTPLATIFATRMRAGENEKENLSTKISADAFLRRLSVVENRLADGRAYLMGDQFTIADISVGYALDFAAFLGLAEQMPDIVKAYHVRLRERPAYKRAAAK